MSAPVIILVAPQLGENIGMCARAMLNCGLRDLRLVQPRDGWPNPGARAAASGALEVLEAATVWPDTRAAVADLAFVYATTGRDREMVTRVLTPRMAAQDMRMRLFDTGSHDPSGAARCGVLFGGERSGLGNEDVSLADSVISVPLNPRFRSLNLAQAVLLIGYEWFQTCTDESSPVTTEEEAAGEAQETTEATGAHIRYHRSRVATKGELNIFLDRLFAGLDAGDFFRAPDLRPTVTRNLRNFFQRSGASEQELRTLHGVIEALKRAGRN